MSKFKADEEIYYVNTIKCGDEYEVNRPCGYYPAKYVRYSDITKLHIIKFLSNNKYISVMQVNEDDIKKLSEVSEQDKKEAEDNSKFITIDNNKATTNDQSDAVTITDNNSDAAINTTNANDNIEVKPGMFGIIKNWFGNNKGKGGKRRSRKNKKSRKSRKNNKKSRKSRH